MDRRMTRILAALALLTALAGSSMARAQGYTPHGNCPTHQWDDGYGSMTTAADCLRPGFSDLSGSATLAQLPAQPIYAIAADNINFNAANTDNAVTIALASGVSGYRLNAIYIANASGSLTTATVGVFTATGGGGTAIVTGGTAVTVAAAPGGSNSIQSLALTAATTTEYTFTTLYFHIGTAEGAAATASAVFYIQPMP
jgi:hypothetical protein